MTGLWYIGLHLFRSPLFVSSCSILDLSLVCWILCPVSSVWHHILGMRISQPNSCLIFSAVYHLLHNLQFPQDEKFNPILLFDTQFSLIGIRHQPIIFPIVPHWNFTETQGGTLPYSSIFMKPYFYSCSIERWTWYRWRFIISHIWPPSAFNFHPIITLYQFSKVKFTSFEKF